MKIRVIIALVAVFVAVAGYAGFAKFEQYQFIETIRPHAKNASLRLANAVRYETEKDTKVTFKELFEKFESEIIEIDKKILDVQTVTTPSNKELADSLVDYLKGGRNLLRALLWKSRKDLAVSSALDWNELTGQELRASSPYGYEYAKKSSDNALQALKKAKEEYTRSVMDVTVAAKYMKIAHAKVAAIFPNEILVDSSIFEEILDAIVFDAIRIESSFLGHDPVLANIFMLHALLHNRAPQSAPYPHLILTLTDEQDKPLARTTFHPVEYLEPNQIEEQNLAANNDLSLKLKIDITDIKPSGYRLALFYPQEKSELQIEPSLYAEKIKILRSQVTSESMP